jgi:hypothetical protein
MALQQNGITIAEVVDRTTSVRVLIGSTEFKFVYGIEQDVWMRTSAIHLDGRRDSSGAKVPERLRGALHQQLEAIALDHGWKAADGGVAPIFTKSQRPPS